MSAVLVRSREGWLAQAQRSRERLEAALAAQNRPAAGATLIELAEVDFEPFCLLVEALCALGVPLDPALAARAQLRPVDERFGVR